MSYNQVDQISTEKAFMMSYLWSMYTLAVGIYKLEDERDQVAKEKNDLYVRRVYIRQQLPPLSSYIKVFAIRTFFLTLACLIAWGAIVFMSGRLFPFLNDEGNETIAYIALILCGILSFALLVFLVSKSKPFIYLKQRQELIKEDRQAEADFNNNEDLRMENAAAEETELDYQILEISNLIDQAQYQLDSILSMDILHKKYRELPIVYTMYEYFETGAVDTLKEAINKYDQESRMDKMIAQLERIDNNFKEIYNKLSEISDRVAENTRQLERLNSHMEENNRQLQQQTGYMREISENTRNIEFNTGVIAATNTSMLLIEKEREFRRKYL